MSNFSFEKGQLIRIREDRLGNLLPFRLVCVSGRYAVVLKILKSDIMSLSPKLTIYVQGHGIEKEVASYWLEEICGTYE